MSARVLHWRKPGSRLSRSLLWAREVDEMTGFSSVKIINHTYVFVLHGRESKPNTTQLRHEVAYGSFSSGRIFILEDNILSIK